MSLESYGAHSAVQAFALKGKACSITPYGNGHINDTYLVVTDAGTERYILQRINTNVFKKPYELMENIAGVTAHLMQRVHEGKSTPREVLTLIPTNDVKSYHIDAEGNCWRVYVFVENTVTCQAADTPERFYEAACAFGRFCALLDGYPLHTLYETIPGFHNTPQRYEQLEAAIRLDPIRRAGALAAEIDFAFQRKEEAGTLYTMQKSGELPLRATHNDTKLNNVLFDAETGKGICVIDLDTVMPGLSAHDFGDAIRFGANTSDEDERDLTKCELSLTMYGAYTKGFITSTGGTLTKTEISMLPMGAKLMTLECGVRFLADYINGDVYFKVHREGHNLDRARNQFRLVESMEHNFSKMLSVTEALGKTV